MPTPLASRAALVYSSPSSDNHPILPHMMTLFEKLPPVRGVARLVLGAMAMVAFGAAAAENNLPLPRFVSLDDVKVYARAGPDFRFPVEWVFLRKAMPVEVIDQYEDWRRVRDKDGVGGWIHRRMLTGRRSVIVDAPLANLRVAPEATAPAIARAEEGAQGLLDRCISDWCHVKFASYGGWMKRADLWGVYSDESWD